MRFLEWPSLTRLCALLHSLDVGDRVVRCRLELLSTAAETVSESDLRETIEKELHSSPLFGASAPPPVLLSPKHGCSILPPSLGVNASSASRGGEAGSQDLLVNLISTLNQCFPDFEFSSTLTPAMFRERTDLCAVEADINSRLAGVEAVLPGFLRQLWEAVRSAVAVERCAVYEHVTSGAEDPTPLISLFPPSGNSSSAKASDAFVSLSSFFYFFIDPTNDKLLFFAGVFTAKANSPSWNAETERNVAVESDGDDVDIGDVYTKAEGGECILQDATDEADSLSDLELPSSACAFA